jgi:ribosomal protein S21
LSLINQVEAALKQLKKQMLEDGLNQEMKRLNTMKRRHKSAQADTKQRKALKRKLEHESD